jgi:hypothetical protein
MTDDPDFLDRVERSHERWTGEQWSPEKTLDSFMLHGRAKRIEALEQLDAAVKEAGTTNLREYSRLTRLQRDMESKHQAMIKSGR